MRTILIGLAAMLLAGCYQSQEPLFAATDGHCPLTETTQFGFGVITPASDDGMRTPVKVEPAPTGECLLQTRGGAARLVFVETPGGPWLVQVTPDQAIREAFNLPEGVIYVLAREENGAWIATPPSCGGEGISELEQHFQVQRTTNELGLEVCAVGSADDLRGMMGILSQMQFLPLVFFEPA
jgi:hypothetical protein